jgi:Rap1a immunity proteins
MNTVRLHGIGCAIATVIIGMTTSGASGAPFLSGNELYTSCTSPADRGECIGYVEGVLDTADFEGLFYKGNSNLHAAVEGSNVEWCPPPGITSGQAADVATKFLRDNPQVRHDRASSLIAQAMKAAWPCTK